ncbi:MAG: acyltransferase [Myxococcales bacterium]|nr:acyltransferase [Myxococcales bacterium]
MSHWANLGETTFVAGIRVLFWIWRWFGRLPFRLVLVPVVVVHWATNRVARHASADYLRRWRLLGVGPGGGSVAVVKHFLSFGETILDKLVSFSGHYPYGLMEFQNVEMMIERIQSGRGGIIVTSHVGCLELCQVASGRRSGFRMTVLTHTRHAERFNRLLSRVANGASEGIRLLQVTELGPSIAETLKSRVDAGEFIAIAGDRVPVGPSTRTLEIPFLGEPAVFPQGPYLLALLMRCPVFMMTCMRQRSGRHRVSFDLIADLSAVPRDRRGTAISAAASRFVSLLEDKLRETPLEWFNFFPFWRRP